MKIAHLVSTFRPYHGGMGNVAYEMAKNLAARGHEVSVFTPAYNSEWPKTEQLDGFTVRRLEPVFRYGNAAYLPNLSELQDYDVIHLHHPFLGAHKVLKLKKPLFVTYHMDLYGTGYKRPIFAIHEKWFLPRLFKKAAGIIYNSQDYFNFSKSKKLVKDISQISFLPFGVDDDFRPGEPVLSSVLGRGPSARTILFVGGLDKAHYFKGLHNLLCAMKHLDRDDLNLQIVGSGNLEVYYQKMVTDLKLSNVSFVGSLSREKLIQAYQSCDFLVLPSVDSTEAFGLVLLEAMACGKPVLASDLPGVRSIIGTQGEVGLLCKPNCVGSLTQKLSLLLASDLVKLGQSAREKVLREYRWPTIIEKLENLYSNIK